LKVITKWINWRCCHR